MSFKIKSDVNTTSTVVVQGKNTGVSITTSGDGAVYNTNINGEITVPVASVDDTTSTIRDFPLSQFGNPYDTDLEITSSGLNLVFNKEIQAFVGGLYLNIAQQTIPLLPSRTYNVYIGLTLGIATYHVNTLEEAETNVNMFIGKVITNGSSITTIDISQVSRFSNYRASTIPQGSAFPVSTGHPSQTGTINW